MQQLSLFDVVRAPRVICSVDPDGPVVKGDPQETLMLPHPRMAWALARIELHPHSDGLWMWSVSMAGGGYKVGAKWGRFAQSRDDALSYARDELLERQAKVREPSAIGVTPAMLTQIGAWARSLQ